MLQGLKNTSYSNAIKLLEKLQDVNLEEEHNFEVLFEKYKINECELEDLCLKITEGPKKGSNLIWFIAIAALAGCPQYLEHFWKKFGQEIASAELRVLGFQGISVLWLLTRIAFINCQISIIQDLSTQRSDIYTHADLATSPTNYPALKELYEAILRTEVAAPLQAKASFHQQIEKVKGQTEEFFLKKIDVLEEKARRAKLAGYCSAFYDLGNVTLQFGYIKKALAYFKQVPNNSHDFADASIKIATIYYSLALEKDTHERDRYLRKSCKYTRFGPGKERRETFELIAKSFVHEGRYEPVGEKTIPEELLDAMHAGTSSKWCWHRLQDLKEKHMYQNEIDALKKENAALKEQLKEKREDRQSIEGLSNLIKEFGQYLTIQPDKNPTPSKPALTIAYNFQRPKDNIRRSHNIATVSPRFKLRHSAG